MKAKRLNKNSIIGVCAPSGYVKEKNKEELDYAQKLLKELDLEVKYSKNLYSNSLGYSATVEEKQEDINFLIKDKSVNAIAFAKGGNNANSILDLIDYEDIKKNPKIFFGFSDNTVLLNAIYKMTGLITYHFTNIDIVMCFVCIIIKITNCIYHLLVVPKIHRYIFVFH